MKGDTTMNARTISLTLLLALTSLLASDRAPASVSSTASAAHERIRFLITTVEERGGARNVISEATVEGPAGTDFQIDLQGERFKMGARFLTDLMRPDALRIRAKLDTHRFYGYSERQLPLYEEDKQSETLDLGFDEAVVLLPFGRGGDDQLKIEITPSISEQTAALPSGKARPLEIKIAKESPGGSIEIKATKVPHRFVAEATLVENGQEVARGTGACLLEEAQEIKLQPTAQARTEIAAQPLVVRLSLDEYARSRPLDQAAISFDVYRMKDAGQREQIAANWAGIAALGANLSYDLGNLYAPGTNNKYELRFNIRLADDEQSD
jgi:hypothetical protein